jgi:hypothetical protein
MIKWPKFKTAPSTHTPYLLINSFTHLLIDFYTHSLHTAKPSRPIDLQVEFPLLMNFWTKPG